jgi:hypothetical protein
MVVIGRACRARRRICSGDHRKSDDPSSLANLAAIIIAASGLADG